MPLLTSDEITRMTPEERIALISQLWDSLDANQVPVSTAQMVELERRRASLDHDRRHAVSWAELKAELERRCP